MPGELKYLNPLGVAVTIYYQNNPEQVVNRNSLDIFMKDIAENFGKYNTNIFNGLRLNIWDYRRSDIPNDLITEDPITHTLIRTDIKDMAGESWGSLNLMNLNSIQTETDQKLALVLSHEIGHIIDFKTENNDIKDIIMPIWKQIRGDTQANIIDPIELMAEDIMTLYGCRGAKGVHRGKQTDPRTVQGLSEMLLIWKKVYEFTSRLLSVGVTIKNIYPDFRNTDFKYFGIYFRAKYSETQFYDYHCDRSGWYEKVFWPNGIFKEWKDICRF